MFFVLLAVAGNETTRNLIAHAMLALIEHPDVQGRAGRQHRRRRAVGARPPRSSCAGARRSTTSAAPRPATPRSAARPIKAGRQGRHLLRRRPTATRTQFDRPATGSTSAARPNDHLTFGGGGAHFCLGANLARGADQGHDARVPAPLPERRGRRRAPPHALRLHQRHQVPAGAPQRLIGAQPPGTRGQCSCRSSRATRPSRSATVTVNAEWPFRRMGEGTGSRKVNADAGVGVRAERQTVIDERPAYARGGPPSVVPGDVRAVDVARAASRS